MSINSTDLSVFVMETYRVFCEAETELLYTLGGFLLDRAMPQAVIRRSRPAEARFRCPTNPYGISLTQSVTITGFSPSTSVFPCQYHSTNAPYQFIHLPPTLYNVSLPALQFSPVSTIPPMLHTHSFTYHPHYIIFLSQYFSFPLSVPLHQCSTPIHSPTTHTI